MSIGDDLIVEGDGEAPEQGDVYRDHGRASPASREDLDWVDAHDLPDTGRRRFRSTSSDRAASTPFVRRLAMSWIEFCSTPPWRPER
jgi:hypothetical protein